MASDDLERKGDRPRIDTPRPTGATTRTALVVCADDQHRELEVATAETIGLAVKEAKSAGAALAMLEATPCNFVLTSLHLPDHDGFALVRAVKARFPEVAVVAVVDHHVDRPMGSLASFDAVLPVPVDSAALRRVVDSLGQLVPRPE